MKIKCDYCGKTFEKYPCQISEHNFCSRKCYGLYITKVSDSLAERMANLYKKGKSLPEIAGMFDLNTETVRSHLKKIGVSMREPGEAYSLACGHSVNITDSLLEKLDGFLLGDGSLQGRKYSGQLGMNTSRKGFATFVREGFEEDEIEGSVCSTSDGWFYYSKSYREFKNQRKRWYPNGVKRVPKDLKFTECSILWWFLGDGKAGAYLSTQGFSREDVELLSEKFEDLGLETEMKWNGGWMIHIISLAEFYSFIGECPVSSLSYRWNKY